MWSIAGKTVVITGATSGIGLESAAALAADGASVVLLGRDAGRLAQAAGVVRERSSSAPATYVCDFASLNDVARLAARLAADLPAVHVLINNAGAVHAKRTLTTDGLEATFAVNHLAHFLLTERLRPTLVASAPARVITVASGQHFNGTMDFDDLGFQRGYRILSAYARSKLANVLFATELARRLEGTGVTSNAVHPGRVDTNIWSGAPRWSQPILRLWLRRSFISSAEGAAPVVALATAPEGETISGRYFDRFADVPPSSLAQDASVATRLWEESERMVAFVQ